MSRFANPLLSRSFDRPVARVSRSITDDASAPRLGPVTLLILLVGAAIIGWIALAGSIPVAGALYAILFVALTVVRPDLSFLIIFVQAPLVWDLSGGPVKMAMADTSLVLATPVLFIRLITSGKRLAVNPLRWPIASYLLICVFSTLLNGTLTESLTSMLQMMLYLGLAVFVYANCIDHPQVVFHALYGLLFTDVVLSVAMLVFRSNYVLGLHKNGIGSELDYAVVIAVEIWLYRATRGDGKKIISALLLVLGGALFFSLSRGAWLGTIVGILVLFTLHRRFGLALKILVVLIPVVVACWLLLPKESKDYAMDFSSSARNIEARYQSVAFAADLFRQDPVFGKGVGLRKMYDATNVIMSTLAETGVLGLLTFLLIFVLMARMVWKTCKALPQTSPVFALAAISGALMAAKFAHGCVDHYWSRVMLPVWAMAGVAVWCFNISIRRAAPSTASALASSGESRG